MMPAVVTLGKERRRPSRAARSVFFPGALGTIEEDIEYEERVSPRNSFGHPASACSSIDGREDVSATKAQQLVVRNAELEARLVELERKLSELAARTLTKDE